MAAANKMPAYIQVGDVTGDTDSVSGAQPMSISTSIDSLKNARSDDDILSDVEFATENLSVQSSKHSSQVNTISFWLFRLLAKLVIELNSVSTS